MVRRWGIASLLLSLLVVKVVTYSRWRKPWRRFVVPVSARGRGRDKEALISKECGGVGRWSHAPLVLYPQVEKAFAPSRWRRPCLRFSFVGGGRRGRRRYPKDAAGTGCAGLHSWWVIMYRRSPCRSISHAKAAMSVMKIFDGIVLKCFQSNVKRIIPRLTQKLQEKNQ